jgi:hypothetical protein
MAYRVTLSTIPASVIDEKGNPVAGSLVHRITFPHGPLDTAQGRVWVITGPGVAEISVAGTHYVDVPIVSQS